jgi:hypothetical protein
MRAYIDENGEKRINAKIEIQMSIDDVSIYLISAVHNRLVCLSELLHLNKRQLLRLAKEEIWNNGVKAPLSNSDKLDLDDEVSLRNHVKAMFPELL